MTVEFVILAVTVTLYRRVFAYTLLIFSRALLSFSDEPLCCFTLFSHTGSFNTTCFLTRLMEYHHLTKQTGSMERQ